MFENCLRVKNFGPIKDGYTENDGFIPFNQLCVFCGTQGTGKSTIVKLYSTFVWLEKAIIRGDFKPAYVEQYNRFANKYLEYQGIQSYLKNDTELWYKGQCVDFYYNKKLLVDFHNRGGEAYDRPQIMYFPAERTLLSVIEKASGIKGMPLSLATLLEDYRLACRAFSGDLPLPINGVNFHYDKLNQIASLISPDYKVRLSEASSGLQTLSPLYVTLHYLSETIDTDESSSTSGDEEEKIDKRINDLLRDDTLSEELRSKLIKKLSNNRNTRLVNIIEEPEQNLFPDSQEKILHQLISLSAQQENQLLLTTHSPYMLNYLMLAIKANEVAKVIEDVAEYNELEKIAPSFSHIDGQRVTVYQLDLDGTINQLEKYENMPSDENYLNQHMMDINRKYTSLLEIQSRYE